MKGFLLLAMTISLSMVCGAVPFWYQDAAPATNRVAVSADDAVGGTAMESRRLSEAWSDETTFTTYPRGLTFFVR